MGVHVGEAGADPYRIHLSLLSGLLSHIGLKDVDKQEYAGARGAKFAIFPGSALFRRTPRFVMAAELVETSRLWARIVARIEPEWAESLAGHLVKRSYSEPHWEASAGAVLAMERVTLFGVPLVVARKVNYGRIDPALSRELFIRHALVEGDWSTEHRFFHANRELLEEVEELEHRARRRDIVVDDETLFAFYDRRVGDDVVSARHFDSWWKKTRRTQPDLLDFSAAMLVTAAAAGVSKADYPDVWRQGDLKLPLTYQFEPGADADGVTVHIALPVLNQVVDDFDWQVPGLRQELITALVRALPKAVRRNYAPVPDHVKAVLEAITPREGGLLDAVGRELGQLTGVEPARSDWEPGKLPDHLRMTIRVEDERGRTLAEGKDLAALKERLRPLARAAVAAVARGVEQPGLRSWTIGTVPRVLHRTHGAHAVTAYPGLVDEGETVGLRVFETEAERDRAHGRGIRRLLLLTVPSPIPWLGRRLSAQTKLGLTRYPYGTVPDLLEDCVAAAVDKLIDDAGGPAWDEAGFAGLREAVRADLTDTTVDLVVTVERIVAAAHEVRGRLGGSEPSLAPALEDMRAQLVTLIRPGFVTATGAHHLPDLPRYLRAIARRAEKLPQNSRRDADWMRQVAEVQREYAAALAALPPHRRDDPEVVGIRWMIEELRVSFFAQDLRTPYPVSAPRILRTLSSIMN
jgi:ATP-dependent helicase HrpA